MHALSRLAITLSTLQSLHELLRMQCWSFSILHMNTLLINGTLPCVGCTLSVGDEFWPSVVQMTVCRDSRVDVDLQCPTCMRVWLCSALQPSDCGQYPANGEVTFTDIHIVLEGKYEAKPTWSAQQYKPACNSQATVLSPSSLKFTWNTSGPASTADAGVGY